MQFPLFGFADQDLSVFSSISEARAEIEPIDAKDSLWEVYNRTGQRLGITIIRSPLWTRIPFFWLTTECVELFETGEVDKECLAAKLKRSLETVRQKRHIVSKEWLEVATLDELVYQAVQIFARH